MTPLNQFYSVVHKWNSIIETLRDNGITTHTEGSGGEASINGIIYSGSSCAYCIAFDSTLECKGCLISDLTHREQCRGTPYYAFRAALQRNDPEGALIQAVRMRDVCLQTKPENNKKGMGC